MSVICRKLCSSILSEHFGQIVQCVAEDLFKHDAKPLDLICYTTRLPLTKIKEALCVLIKHGFVVYSQTERGLEYSLIYENILLILRYPKYMFFVKTMCGDESEMILEEVLMNGYITASEVITKTYKKIEQSPSGLQPSVPVLKEKFELLVKNQFLTRSLCTDTVEEKRNEKPDFTLPDLNLTAIIKKIEGDNNSDPGDSKIYWKVNFDRLIQDLRDQIIVSAITRRLDENAGELMRQLLFLMYLRTASWAHTSNPIPFTEIKEAVKKINYPLLTHHIDQYLHLIEEDSSQFLKRVGESGGHFCVNMKGAFEQLAWATLENIVTERFGSKAARIFRLVRDKKYIEQEQIQQLAMIPAKEAKHLTYTLLQENYLQIQEIKKSGVSAAPIKTFFLFHIDLNLVVHMEVEHCYQALYNIMQRREYEISSNKRMIDKQLRMQTLTTNLKEHGATEEQLAEIADLMTPSEKQQLDKVQNKIKKLGITELQIDDTLFLLTMYLRYH